MAAGLTKTQLVRHLAEKAAVNNKTAAAFLENLAGEDCPQIMQKMGPTMRSWFQRYWGNASPQAG